jgi:hypothetical protein
MAKAKKTDTLIVRGGGGAVWEVDDSPAIRNQIECGYLELVRGTKTTRKAPTEPSGDEKPKVPTGDEKPAGGEGSDAGDSGDVASGLEDGDEKPAGDDDGQGD